MSHEDVYKLYKYDKKLINPNIKQTRIHTQPAKAILSYNNNFITYQINSKNIKNLQIYDLYSIEAIQYLNLKITHTYIENSINYNKIDCLYYIINKPTFFSYMNLDFSRITLQTFQAIINLGYELDYNNYKNIVKNYRFDILCLLYFKKKNTPSRTNTLKINIINSKQKFIKMAA